MMGESPAAEHVIGRYVLCGELASGGMATVYLGRLFSQAGFSRTVAIKRLHPQLAKDHDFAAMFVDEARLAARVRHPNVVPTLDVEAVGDELFLVMEYVAGESLSRVMRLLAARGERMPPEIASSVLSGALLGLHAAHEATAEDGTPLGVVHRDVSPQNIMVGADGSARVLDFGVAKAAVRAQITRDGQIKGKVAYMPPEQLQAQPVDRRADVYGAAVVLWEALAGRRLFDAEHEAAVLMQVMSAEVSPPGALVPGLPAALDAVVMRGLARDKEQRYRSALEMAVALEEAAPPASPRKVAEWLARVAGGALERRAQQVKEVESRRIVAPPSAAPLSAPSGAPLHAPRSVLSGSGMSGAGSREEGSQISSIAVTSGAAPSPRGRRLWAGAIACLLIGAGIAVAFVSRSMPSDPAPPASGAPAATPGPSEVLSAAPAVTPVGPATASSSAATASPSVARTASSKGTRPPGKATAPAAGCNPPYTVDARGIRRMKPECL